MISSVHWLAGLATLLLLLTAGSAAAQVSTVCTFTAGPRAGTSVDYAATWSPLPVGTPCLDGMGSTGFAGAGNARRTVGMSTVCHFTAGPRAGSSFDYRATWSPLAVGTPCLDGMGPMGGTASDCRGGPTRSSSRRTGMRRNGPRSSWPGRRRGTSA